MSDNKPQRETTIQRCRGCGAWEKWILLPGALSTTVLISAVVGLSLRLGQWPTIDNIVFVAVAAVLIGGLIPLYIVIGIVMVAVGTRLQSPRAVSVAYVAWVLLFSLAALHGLWFGPGLDF